MAIFIFAENGSGMLVPVARTGLRARMTSPPSAAAARWVVIETVAGQWSDQFGSREIGQLYARSEIAEVLDVAVGLIRDQPIEARLPAVDRRSWELGTARLSEWDDGLVKVLRVHTDVYSTIEMVENAIFETQLQIDVVDVLATRSIADLGDLARHAMDAWRDALEALTRRENAQMAQDELLRLANVARAAGSLSADTAVPERLRPVALDLSRACEAATATLSASLTAALLAVQHRAERAEAEGRQLLEQGQRRLAAIAAALIFPTIVVGVAGANFVQPSPGHRWWAASVTIGAALVAAAAGIGFAQFISSSSERTARTTAWAAAIVGAALIVFAYVALDR